MRQWFGAVSKNPRELQDRIILINDDNLTSPAKNLTRPGKEMACQTTVEDFRTGASKLLNVSLGKELRFQASQVINLDPQNTMDTLSKRTSKTSKKKKHWDLSPGRKPCFGSGFGGNLWPAALRGSS